MITYQEAREIAEREISREGLHVDNEAFDDGEYFIFGYTEEVELPPVGVVKATGKVETYFPPEHMDAFLEAVAITE